MLEIFERQKLQYFQLKNLTCIDNMIFWSLSFLFVYIYFCFVVLKDLSLVCLIGHFGLLKEVNIQLSFIAQSD